MEPWRERQGRQQDQGRPQARRFRLTTPDDVKLYGKFGYTDTAGVQLVDACLKKPLYVWTKNCPAIPKMLPKGQGQYSQCTCSICEVGLGVACIC
jgi:hypothetical protein